MSEDNDATPKIVVETVGFDARFPNTNQTKNCWQNYVDYYKCIEAKGEDFAPCKQFQKAFRSLCPIAWVERWDEGRENGFSPHFGRPAASSDH